MALCYAHVIKSMLNIFSFASLSNIWNSKNTTTTTTNNNNNNKSDTVVADSTTTSNTNTNTTGPLQFDLSDRESHWIRRVLVLLMKHHLTVLVATLYKDVITFPWRVFTSFISSSS